MKKTGLLIIMIISCIPTLLRADDESRYLAGAVPEVNGKIVFTKEFDNLNTDGNTIFEFVYDWLDDYMKGKNNTSRIVYSEKEKGQIVASGEEYLVFTNSALSLDRALMSYNLILTCKPGKCEIQLDRIRYNYENKRIAAEEQIADKVALNKNKTTIYRGVKKFRIHTVDFVDEFFDNIRAALGVPAPTGNEATNQTPAGVSPAVQAVPQTPVQAVSQTQAPAPAVIRPQMPAPAVNQTPPAPVTESTASTQPLQGYRSLSPDKIPGNIIKMIGEDWMLITAGTDEKFNMMTAGWGGLGILYGKPVAICFINPTRYTYQLMETNDTYTLTFYTEAYREALNYTGTNSGRDVDKVKGSGLTPITTPLGSKAFSEAWLIIECRKLVAQSLSHDALFDEQIKSEWTGKQLHKMFIGEILNVWVK